jgi:hypothetical protein
MNTVVLSEQKDLKIPSKIKTTTVEMNEETKEDHEVRLYKNELDINV